MKVKDLIELLQPLDPEMDILMSGDPAGNYFHSLIDVEVSFTSEDNEPMHPDDALEYEGKLHQTVVLWP